MALATQPQSLQRQLRSATHAAHVRLNHHPLLNQVTRPTLERWHYTLILQAYWSFYQVAEAHIRACLASGMTSFIYTDRYKTDWLAQDLCHFGLTPGSAGCCPFTLDLVKPKNTAELIGMMYPLEGSTLGGQVISKHLVRNLDVTGISGGRFFNGYGDQTERFWLEFNDFASRSLETQGEREQACAYANYLFEKLEAFLDVHVS